MKRSLRLLAVIPVLLALSGCAALSQFFKEAFREPTLTFKNASLTDASLGGATVNLVYELHNPNEIGLNLASLDYKFAVEGHQVVAGMPRNGLNIPPNGSTNLVFPAAVKFQDIAPVIETFLNKDFAKYHAEGHIGIQTPLGVLQLPISKDGEFEVPKVPQVQFQQPRIVNISFTGAQLEFPLSVTNRNSYVLPIDQLVGGLSIAGANVGTLQSQIGTLPGKQAKQVTLPLTVNFGQAAQAALALRNGNANVAWNGKIQSGAISIPVNFQQNLSFRR